MRSELGLPMLAAALMVAGCAGDGATGGSEAPSGRPAQTDVSEFKATGEPRRCIPLRGTNLTPAGERHVMARINANTHFRNELRGTCPGLRRDRVIVLRSNVGQICELDVIEVLDPISRISFGICTLGMFTPVEVPRGARW